MKSALDFLDRNMPILVVDDYETVRRVVKNCLRQLGFENVVEAPDGAAAWEELQNGSFNLVIADWYMPGLMGQDLLKAARDDGRLKNIPFLMVAAEAQKKQMAQAINDDHTAHIVKPFTAQVLREKMAALFCK